MDNNTTNSAELVKDKKIKELENEIITMKSSITKERECTVSLVSQIAKIFWGYDEEFNDLMRDVISKIDTNKSLIDQADSILELQSILHTQSKKMNLFHGSVANYLKEIPQLITQCTTLPDNFAREAERLNTVDDGKEITHKILKILHLTEKTILHFKSSCMMQSENVLPNDFRKEILSLISGVDLSGELSQEMKSYIEQLSNPISFIDTPELMKKIILTLIKNANKERDNATYLLSSINDHINVIQGAINKNIDGHRGLNLATKKYNSSIDSHITDLCEICAANENNVLENLQMKIASLYDLSSEKDKFVTIQDKLLVNLEDIEHKISFIKNEANDLNKTITETANKNKLDLLTSLNNRFSFDQHFEADMFTIEQIQPIFVLVADIDNFNDVNVKYNPNVGDKILRVLGLTLRKSIDPNDFIARLGEDQFGIIMYKTNEQGVETVANKIISAVKSIPFHYKNEKVNISISVVAKAIRAKTTSSTIISEIDKHFDENKNEQGMVINRSMFYMIKEQE